MAPESWQNWGEGDYDSCNLHRVMFQLAYPAVISYFWSHKDKSILLTNRIVADTESFEDHNLLNTLRAVFHTTSSFLPWYTAFNKAICDLQISSPGGPLIG